MGIQIQANVARENLGKAGSIGARGFDLDAWLQNRIAGDHFAAAWIIRQRD